MSALFPHRTRGITTPPRQHSASPCRTPSRRNMVARTRVACMGDSITRGNASHEPGKNGTHRPHKPKIANRGNFPLELQRLMGASWEVRNFGHGGRSVVGASAYDKTAEFERACRFAPAIVLLMLGTNDAKVCPAPPTRILRPNPNPNEAQRFSTPNPNQVYQHSHP